MNFLTDNKKRIFIMLVSSLSSKRNGIQVQMQLLLSVSGILNHKRKSIREKLWMQCSLLGC